jgi:ABC-2 type transport system permease protein
MRAALLIAGKDLRQRLRDRSAILMAVLVPLALAFVFNAIMGGVDTGGSTFRYGVVDGDRGDVTRAFVSEVLRPIEEQDLAVITEIDSVEEARRRTAEGRLDAVFVFPAGFSAAVRDGEPAEIQIVGDVDAPVAAQVAGAIANSFAADLTGVRLAVAVVLHGGQADPADAPALVDRAVSTAPPVHLEDVSASRRELDPKTFFAAGMAVFFLFFTVQFGVSSLLEERHDGTLSRLLAAPIGRGSILGGKLLTSFLLGLISMTVLITATSLLLGAAWGNVVGVALLVVAGILAAMGVTAVVATLARTAEQAGSWQAIIAVVLGLLGGVFFPIHQVGGLIGSLSLLTPHAWFMRGLADLSGGAGPGAVLPAVAAILTFAAVTGAIAFSRLGKVARP